MLPAAAATDRPSSKEYISSNTVFSHTLREGAPRNRLRPRGEAANKERIVSHFKTEDGNFGANNPLQIHRNVLG